MNFYEKGIFVAGTKQSQILKLYQNEVISTIHYGLLFWDKQKGGEAALKCVLCGAEVKEQPKITADGKCSVCGAKLAVKK